jgi:nickel/cobalt transporter (NiCoT) family protein
LVSIVVALLIGSIEALGLLRDKLGLVGEFWDFIAAMNDNFGALGYLIIGVFAVSWLLSIAVYRLAGYDGIAQYVD